MVDTRKLKAKIIEKGYTQKRVAQFLGISSTALNNKLNNKSTFKSPEMFKVCTLLGVEDAKAIFFVKNVDDTEPNKNKKGRE